MMYGQFLILFLLVTLNYGYLSFNIDCYYLKANTIANNLTECLILIKYHIYNLVTVQAKYFLRFCFLFKLTQCFLISIHFFLVCKLISTLSFTKSQFLFTFFTMSVSDKFLIWFIKKKEAKQRNCAVDFLTPFWGKLTLTLIFNMCIKDLVHFVMFETLTFIFLKT